MSEESKGGEAPAGHKAISPAWDRRQSTFLMLSMGLVLTIFIGLRIFTLVGIDRPPMWFFWSLGFSAGFAGLVWRMRAGTPGAATLGGSICLAILSRQLFEIPWTKTALPELILLFILTFGATRFGRRRKETLGLTDRRERRGRQASQVMANLGAAGFFAMQFDSAFFAAGLACLVEATADTVSSELGQVFGGRTILFTTGKDVPPGTDGGMSLAGTACGILSGALIVGLAVALGAATTPIAIAAFVAGTAGLLFDSWLGATLERWGWLGNDFVNFASTCCAAYIAMKIVRYIDPPLAFW